MNSLEIRKNAMRKSRGVSLLEAMVAMFILMFGIVSMASLFGVAAGKTKGQGEISTRATEYSQDKMEQLMNLGFGDGATDTTVFPSNPLGGTGLGGTYHRGADAALRRLSLRHFLTAVAFGGQVGDVVGRGLQLRLCGVHARDGDGRQAVHVIPGKMAEFLHRDL